MKKIISFVTILMVLCVSASVVNATTIKGFTFTATPDNTEITAGESVTITITVGDIELGSNGMNTLEGQIGFDSNIFEALSEDDIVGQNNWSASINAEADNAKYGTFFFNQTSSGVKEETVVGSITLKTKTTIQEDTPTVITITNIQSNDGIDLVPTEDEVITININAATGTPDPEVNEIPDMNIIINEVNEIPEMNIITNEVKDPTVNEAETPNVMVNKVDTTIKDGTLPQTGENVFIGMSVLAVGAIAIYFYIRAYKVK